ncbi:hypothetical protein, partial [Halovibrio sp. HP20-59]|uniref:hypothetical protein n=1 Tax=Halovibrio sp. HP20-59 TaxID=3080275 RepID=UPI002AFF7EAD
MIERIPVDNGVTAPLLRVPERNASAVGDSVQVSALDATDADTGRRPTYPDETGSKTIINDPLYSTSV